MSDTENCSICLGEVKVKGGGVPLFTPGCCGKWLHQKCVEEYVKTAVDTKCPSCRQNFQAPAWMLRSPSLVAPQGIFTLPVPPVVPQRVSAPAPPQASWNPFRRIGAMMGSTTSTAANTLENEDVLPETIDRTSTDSNSAIEHIQSSINIVTTPEYSCVGINAIPSFHVRVSLNYDDSPITQMDVKSKSSSDVPEISKKTISSKTALDIVCILDNSGSMQGTKMDSLKAAMRFVVSTLGPNDRLSVVSFNSSATCMHHLLRMTDENKAKSNNLVSSALQAAGGTNIYAGMVKGMEVLRSRLSTNQASCVFLLTDGQDRDNLERKISLVKELKRNGTAVFVFGFGVDHDAEHMMAIAEAAEGTFSYIDTDDTVIDAFGGSIGAMQGSAPLTEIALTLRTASLLGEKEALPADQVVINSVEAGHYPVSMAPDLQTATVRFANMYCGEKRTVLLQLALPAVTSPVYTHLISSSVQFSVLNTVCQHPSSSTDSGCSCEVERAQEGDERLVNPVRALLVEEELRRVEVTTAIKAAKVAADSGDLITARAILVESQESVISSPAYAADSKTAKALLQDVNEGLECVRSHDMYDSMGGKNTFCQTISSNSQQRSAYTKAGKISMYQSPSSTMAQTTAVHSKSSGIW